MVYDQPADYVSIAVGIVAILVFALFFSGIIKTKNAIIDLIISVVALAFAIIFITLPLWHKRD